VAGKTGTAQKPAPEGGYLIDNYIVSFAGFFSGTDSKLVCITSMDNPIGAEGNSPTGPLFASIMQFAANRYMIEPTQQEGGEG
jgi:cell division protein FtsI/penicillin-binding protein 2